MEDNMKVQLCIKVNNKSNFTQIWLHTSYNRTILYKNLTKLWTKKITKPNILNERKCNVSKKVAC